MIDRNSNPDIFGIRKSVMIRSGTTARRICRPTARVIARAAQSSTSRFLTRRALSGQPPSVVSKSTPFCIGIPTRNLRRSSRSIWTRAKEWTLLTAAACPLEVQWWLADYGLECFPKVSGSNGVQVYVPLNTPSSYATTQPLARERAEELEGRHPDKVISRMTRAERQGKVLIDWSQNAEHKTTVSVYSARAKHERPY